MTTQSTGQAIRSMEEPNYESLKRSLGLFASGVNIITSFDEEGPVGFTCQSFYSVSLDPPLISISVMRTSTSYPRIRYSGGFAVNVLRESQRELSNKFAKSGGDKWAGVNWEPSPTGKPLLTGSLMSLDCILYEEHAVGDHYVVYGQIQGVRSNASTGETPLVYFGGAYRSLSGN